MRHCHMGLVVSLALAVTGLPTTTCAESIVAVSFPNSGLNRNLPGMATFLGVAFAPALLSPAQPSVNDGLTAAIAALNSYLGSGPNAAHWRDYLHLDDLQAEASKGNQADPEVLAASWKRFVSGAPGLDYAPFVAVQKAIEQRWQELVAPTADKVASAARQAGYLFVPVTPASLTRDRAALAAPLKRLQTMLATSGANGAGWKKYLRWVDLQTQLQKPAGEEDFVSLRAVEKLFFADVPGLELPVFADAGRALRQYRRTLEAAAEKDLKGAFDAQLSGLADDLAAYKMTPTEKLAAKVGDHLDWLYEHEQAGLLIAAIRRWESRSNLLVQLSEPLLALGVDRTINENTPVNDSILGTAITGTGYTTGRVFLQLIPDPRQAVFEIRLTGLSSTKTVGQNGPATIYATGTTTLSAYNLIELDAHGFRWQPPVARAITSTRVDGVSTGRGRLVQNVASQRVDEGKPQAEQVASQHATDRLNRRMVVEVGSTVTKANQNYLEKFRNPLVRTGEFPAELKFSTSKDALFVRATQADVKQIAAPSDPPGQNQDNAAFIQLHESFANNLAAGLLAGRTLREEDVQNAVIKIRGSLPDSLKSDDEREPWSITFADKEPVSLEISDNEYRITIRGKHYTSGERDFKAMNVGAVYKAQRQGDGIRLVRQGDLQIFPPDFIEGKTTFNMQQTALRSILRKKFGKLFPPETVSEGLELPGKWQQIGKLPLRQLSLKDGWVVLGWGMPGTHNSGTVADKAAR